MIPGGLPDTEKLRHPRVKPHVPLCASCALTWLRSSAPSPGRPEKALGGHTGFVLGRYACCRPRLSRSGVGIGNLG